MHLYLSVVLSTLSLTHPFLPPFFLLSRSIHPPIYPSTHPPTHLSTSLSSICPSVIYHLSSHPLSIIIYLFIYHLLIYPSYHPSTHHLSYHLPIYYPSSVNLLPIVYLSIHPLSVIIYHLTIYHLSSIYPPIYLLSICLSNSPRRPCLSLLWGQCSPQQRAEHRVGVGGVCTCFAGCTSSVIETIS